MMEKSSEVYQERFLLQSFLVLGLIEGGLILIQIFQSSSMEKNVVFLQYSKGLLALGAALLIPLIFLAYELIHSVLRTAHAHRLLEFINVRIVSQPQTLRRVLLALSMLCLTGLYLLVLVSVPSLAHISYTAQIVFGKAYLGLIWAWGMLFQALIFFVILALLPGTAVVKQGNFSEGYYQ